MITPSILFVILTAAILLLIIVVVILENILKSRKTETIKAPEYLITVQLNELKSLKLEPKDMLSKIDALAKKTLWANMNMEEAPDYSQLAEMSASKPHIAQFCAEMAKNLYAGQNISAGDAKSLLRSLEETLREEGKIILVEQKHEKIEEEKFFLDAWVEGIASIFGKMIQNWKGNKSPNGGDSKLQSFKDEIKASVVDEKATEKLMEINPAEELKKLKTKITPEKSKPVSNKKAKKEKEEYQYIESLDVLDRIQNKIKNRNVVKEN